MRKKLSILSVMLVVILCMCTITPFAANTADPFEGKSEINVVYLGGSITQGAGANMSAGEKCWADYVTDYLKEAFSDKKVNYHNVGVGGTDSLFGVYRLEEDVLRKNPDLVFVEFAVNDAYRSHSNDEGIVRSMEGIVRNLMNLENPPYIVFVYTTQYWNNVMYNDFSELHETIAQNYGIPSIDLQPVVEKFMEDNGLDAETVTTTQLKGFSNDGVHPNAEYHKKYADLIIDKLKTGEYYKRANADAAWMTEKDRIDRVIRTAEMNDGNFSGSWTDGDSRAWLGLGYSRYGKKTETPGDSFNYEFYGTTIGAELRILNTGGKIAAEIDGAPYSKVIDCYEAGAAPGNPRLMLAVSGLEEGRHTLKLTVLDDKNGNSTGNVLWIDRVFVNDGEPNNAKGLAFAHKLIGADGDEISGVDADGVNIAEIRVKNENADAVESDILFAVYGSTGELKDVSTFDLKVEPYSYSTFGIGKLIADEGDYIKVYQFSDKASLVPLYKALLFK